MSGPKIAHSPTVPGNRLSGDKIVRVVYLDEAGISNPEEEPYLVCAAVIIHADRQWKKIEKHLLELMDDHVPPENREGFAFHATELFSGGKTFTRENYALEYRWQILHKLVAMPKKFKLPVIYGAVDRKAMAKKYPQPISKEQLLIAMQIVAYLQCLEGVEKWMMQNAGKREVAMLFVENNERAKKHIKEAQNFLRDPRKVERKKQARPDLFKGYPLTRIIDTPYFAEKSDSNPLQIADACAFVIKRHFMRKWDSLIFYPILRPQIIPWKE